MLITSEIIKIVEAIKENIFFVVRNENDRQWYPKYPIYQNYRQKTKLPLWHDRGIGGNNTTN